MNVIPTPATKAIAVIWSNRQLPQTLFDHEETTEVIG